MNWVTYWVKNVIKFCIIKSPGVSSSALLIYDFPASAWLFLVISTLELHKADSSIVEHEC